MSCMHFSEKIACKTDKNSRHVQDHFQQPKLIKKTSKQKLGSKMEQKSRKIDKKACLKTCCFLTSIFIDFWLHFASQVGLIFSGTWLLFSKLAPRAAQERPKSDFRVDLRASRLDFEGSWPLFWTLQALF